MSTKKVTLALAIAAAIGASGPAAAGTITNLDGVLPFTGFDWSQSGQAWIDGYDVTNASPVGTTDNFTLYFQATAIGLKDNGGNTYTPPNLGNTYEYTIFAQVTESVTCIADLPGGGTCDVVSIALVPNQPLDFYAIYYDVPPDANYTAGTGFRDGTQILGGGFTSSNPVIAPQGPTNPGNISLSPTILGTVTFQNLALVQPSFAGTTAVTTLQFGTSITLPWIRPGAIDGVVSPLPPDSNTQFAGQADANQSFQAVPEPATIALVGLGLLVVGIGRARRSS